MLYFCRSSYDYFYFNLIFLNHRSQNDAVQRATVSQPTTGRGRGRGRAPAAPAPAPPTAAPPAAAAASAEEEMCGICMSTDIPKETRHILLPCRHKMLHSTCVHVLRAKQGRKKTCPICRTEIKKDMKYTQWLAEELARIEASTF